jgi:hypothetical protein
MNPSQNAKKFKSSFGDYHQIRLSWGGEVVSELLVTQSVNSASKKTRKTWVGR